MGLEIAPRLAGGIVIIERVEVALNRTEEKMTTYFSLNLTNID